MAQPAWCEEDWTPYPQQRAGGRALVVVLGGRGDAAA